MQPVARRLLLAICALLLLATPLAAKDNLDNPDLSLGRTAPPAAATRDDNILVEGFEATTFPPTGWARLHLSTSYAWARSTTSHNTGVACAWVRYGPSTITQNEWLVTPALDFSALTNPKLEFYEASPYWGSYGEHHYVMVSTTSQTTPASFSTVVDWTPLNHSINENAFGATPTVVNLSAYAGQPVVYVAIRYVGSDADNWYVDDLRIYEPPLHDLALTALTPDLQQYDAMDTPTPQVTVVNAGRSTEDFAVTLTVTENDLPYSQETVNVTGLAMNDETVVDFPALALSPGNYYRLQAEIVSPDDLVPGNNTGSAVNDTYTGPHTPLGMLNTNAGCDPCVQANLALDAYLPRQGDDVACIRIHVWWPGADGIYNANTEQSAFLANGIGADYAPHMWMDAVVDAGSDGSGYDDHFEARKSYHSPLTIVQAWNDAAQELSVTVTVDEPLPPEADLRLRVAITEDDVFYAGSNGESYHDQAFRYMYPTTDGLQVPPAPGVYHYVVPCILDLIEWNYAKLRATVYVQDNDSWKVHNTTTGFLSALTYDVAVGDGALPARLTASPVRPNPFNPSTSVAFSLPAAQRVRVTVHDLEGKLVATLLDEQRAAGPHTLIWDGRDGAGRNSASGTYVFRIEAGGETATRRAMLVK
ncbi:MAG: choice-of-anchor J domain-containing protein [Candidatus Latescibacteria bacterium]|nr:choice-of-anchor J domain-containing protein [Candidatus Latescibacterota bacterium]